MRAAKCDIACCCYCQQMVQIPKEGLKRRTPLCPRCKSVLYFRYPQSIQKTWALIIASLLFYIPANILPMTHLHSLAGTQSDTIISGVIYFMHSGAIFIAFVIFIASIVVPIAKILILAYLLISIQKREPKSSSLRSKLYRLTEIVGRWSMVDIFVVSIMIALVNFGATTQIEAGAGAICFLFVVILTMLAAMSFDPRLIWDSPKETYA